jgi:PAS domain-containing protein
VSAHTLRMKKRSSACCTEAFANCLLASGAACALIDRTHVIRRASRALRAMIPGAVGKQAGDLFGINVKDLLARKGEQIHGVYADAADELVPVILQALYDTGDASGTTLVLAVDGAPFRDAEARRFDTAPFTVVRAGPDGTIRFVSRGARDMLHKSPKRLAGAALASLFSPKDAPRIEEALETCASNKAAEPAVLRLRGQRNGAPLRVSLMPDLAPDKRHLGIVAVIQSTQIEHARDEIKKIALDATITDWRERLRLILRIVKPLIDFKHVVFGVYAEDATLYRAAFLEPEEGYTWPCRWMRLPKHTKQWLQSGRTWIKEIKVTVAKDFPDLENSEVMQLYEERRIVSSVTLPAIGAQGPSSALNLCSTVVGKYGEHDLALMRELGLEPVILRLEDEMQREREIFWKDLRQEVMGKRTLTQAGESIVQKVGKHFRWDYVSLFRVNRSKRRFELVYQYAPHHTRRLRKGSVQSIKAGMLGATLRQSKALVVDDYLSPKSEKHDFKPVNRKFRSAMTSPVHLKGRIRWIMDAESTEADAFRGPDKAALQSIVDAIEEGLAQRVLTEIKSKLLNQNEQGVVLVGMESAILEMNDKAAMLLGLEPGQLERERRTLYLARYGADKLSRDILHGRLSTTGRRIVLRCANGKSNAVFATRSELAESYDMALWFFGDLESRGWSHDLRYLRETVTDVAQQTRAPLTLASALAQRMPELCAFNGAAADPQSHTIAQACERMVAEVRKADITFERLADRLEILKEPIRCTQEVNLVGCVREVTQALPKRDWSKIDPRMPQEAIFVEGDAGRIAFVVRSILGHLLRCRPDEETRVELALGRVDSHAVLNMALTPPGITCETPPLAHDDPLWHTFRAAREDAGLGLTAIEKIVDAHGGTLSKHAPCAPITDSAPPWVAFELVLPLREAVAS